METTSSHDSTRNAAAAENNSVALAALKWGKQVRLAIRSCVQMKGAMMLETMDKSSGNVVGYKISGTVTKTDYETLDPAVDAVIKEYGSINLLLNLVDFHWEKVSAWSSDFGFGKKYKDKIPKMALVGNKKWERSMAKAAEGWYAIETKYFESDNDAWDWLNS